MKKTFLLLTFVIIAMTTMAQKKFSSGNDVACCKSNVTAPADVKQVNLCLKMGTSDGKLNLLSDKDKALNVALSKVINRTSNTFLKASTTLFREPKGTPHSYSLKTYVKDGESNAGVLDGYCDSAYFDGNDIYIKDLVIPVRDGSYVKGTLTSGDVHNGAFSVSLDQPIAAGFHAALGKFDEDGALTIDTKATELTFKIVNDTIVSDAVAATKGVMYVLAVSDKTGEFTQYNSGYKFIPIDEAKLHQYILPANTDMVKYLVTTKEVIAGVGASKTTYYVGRDGDDFYISGLVSDSTIAIKGTLKNGKVVFKMPQFFAKYDNMLYFLRVGTIVKYKDEDGDSVVDFRIKNVDEISFDYNESDKSLLCHDLLLMASGYTFIDYLNQPKFEVFTYKPVVVPSTAVRTSYVRRVTDDENAKEHKYKRAIIARDGNDFYFLDSYSEDKNAAIKATLVGDSIEMDFPQYLGKHGTQEPFVCAGVISSVDASGQTFYQRDIDTNTKQIKFAYDATTGTIKTDKAFAVYYLSGAIWDFYNKPMYTVFTDKVAEVPADATIKPFVMTTSSFDKETLTRRLVNIAQSGNQFFFLNHNEDDASILFTGELKDGMIHVKVPQYVGGDDLIYLYNAHLSSQTYAGKTTYYWDLDSLTTDIALNYNEATNTISSDKLIMMVTMNGDMNNFFYCPSYVPYIAKAGTPKNPDIESWNSGYYSWLGQNIFTVIINCENTEGEFIDPNGVTYRIYFDDNAEPFEFSSEEYGEDFTESTIDIPFNHVGKSITNNVYNPLKRSLWLYETPKEKIGVRTTFTYNGESHNSATVFININTGEITTDGIAKINTENAKVVSTSYYNAVGMQLNKPERGLNIIVKTLSDGTKQSSKIFIK